MNRPLSFYVTLGFLATGVGLFLMILLTLSGFGGQTHSTAGGAQEDDPLETARQTLELDADVNACRAALQQVNLALGRTGTARPPALDPKYKERLQKELGLQDDELAEVGAENYTLLDGWHLGGAFLLRDAAMHTLEPEQAGDELKQEPLDRAAAGFAWVVREVRLADPTDIGLTPPQFVLRRGSGTALERALVFLALLDQLNAADEDDNPLKGGESATSPLLGCLVFCRDKPDGAPRLWACGVMVKGGPDIYLFDPRLGLPLPGEGGKGIATLSAACQKPAVLEQLILAPTHSYDVTAEQARSAELHLVCPLSALAPRMERLQKLLLPSVRVSLARNLDDDLGRLEAAARKTEGARPDVKVWPEGAGVLRRFLPPDEGGADPVRPYPLARLTGFTNPADPAVVQMQRVKLFQLELAPWDAMPPLFRDLDKFPYNVGLGLKVRDRFQSTFLRIALDPQGPRDRLLRGDFDKAASDLVGFGARMRQQQDRRAEGGSDGALEKDVDAWVEKARNVYAQQLLAQERGSPAEREAAEMEVETVWKQAMPVVTLLDGAAAGPGQAEVAYQLGLCKHEKAEQAQARLDLLARRGEKLNAADVEDARTAWRDALGWWKKYGDDHPEESPERPSSCPGRAAAVRQMRARALAMLGDRKAAEETYKDLTEPMSALEKVAALYRARQIRLESEAAKP